MIEKRTFLTVEVTESQRAALRKAGHRDETNMSELVRRAVATTLQSETSSNSISSNRQPVLGSGGSMSRILPASA